MLSFSFSDFLTGGDTTLNMILWPMIAGVIAAACLIFANKKIIGVFVKRLLEEKADSAETAKSLEELGFAKKRLLRFSLRPGSTLRKIVSVSVPEEPDGAPVRYYIPEEKAYRAEVTYDPDGVSVMTILLAIIMFLVLTVLLMTVIPDLIRMASNAFGANSIYSI